MVFSVPLKGVLFLICFAGITPLIPSVFSQYRFINFDYNNGLNANHIHCFSEDSLGYLWMGSMNGLVRYDGYEFKTFYAKKGDTTTLSGNHILDIQTDKGGRVWVSTHSNGISVFDYKKGYFKQIPFIDTQNKPLDPTPIWKIYIDRTGQVWLATQAYGVVRLDRHNHHWVLDSDPTSYLHSHDLFADPMDSTHFYSANGAELRKYSIITGDYQILNEKSSDRDRWFHISADSFGLIWNAPYFDGLLSMDENHQIIRINHWSNTVVRKILRKDKETLWMATEGKGIREYNTRTNETKLLLPQPFDRFSLACKFILSLFKDKRGRIWIGTAIGVSLWDPDQQLIQPHLVNQPGSSQPLMVSDYMKLKNRKDLVAGTYYPDLLHINPVSPNTSAITKSPSVRFLTKPQFLFRAAGKIFVFYINGIALYDPQTDRILPYHTRQYADIIARRGAGVVVQDKHRHFWLTKPPNILLQLNPYSGDVDTFHIGYRSNIYFSRALHVQNDSIVWMEHNGELYRLNTISRRRQRFFPSQPDQKDRLGINDVLVTDSNTVWLSTDSRALMKLRYTGDSLKVLFQYDIVDGLPSNQTGDIVKTREGKIVVSTNQGLCFYAPKYNVFYKVATSSGILDDEVLSVRTKGPMLVATHKMGFSLLQTDRLVLHKSRLSSHIQFIRFSQEQLPIFSKHHRLNDPVRYRQNDVSIGFIAINLSASSTISYRYRLSGIHEWMTAPRFQKEVRYNNLKPGTYRFEVEAKSTSENWGPSSSVEFEIAAPFWMKTWFILLCTLSVSAIAYGVIYWRWSQIKARERLKVKYEIEISKLQLKALRSQMNPHFMFNSLNSIKNYILKHETTLAAEYLSNFSHLIRMILQYSNASLISLEEELEILFLYIDLEKMRFKDTFDFSCQIDKGIDTKHIKIPPMLLQPYVENAIWHGLLHKKEDRTLNIKFIYTPNHVICEIEDNGIGRNAAQRLKSKSASRYKSMGMGIIKDRINLLNSTSNLNIKIEVVDKSFLDGSPAGTLIKLFVPYANHHH